VPAGAWQWIQGPTIVMVLWHLYNSSRRHGTAMMAQGGMRRMHIATSEWLMQGYSQ